MSQIVPSSYLENSLVMVGFVVCYSALWVIGHVVGCWFSWLYSFLIQLISLLSYFL